MGTEGEKEIRTIPRCPLCSEEHSYNIIITRSYTVSFIEPWRRSGKEEQPRKIQVTRLFTCPTKNQDFQAKFLVVDWPSSPIQSVEVEK